ncbi:MAG: TIGR03118 family protein [Nevskia sp.]|nr:TIGR03118 family protein [Nevskia sp.]
MHSSQVLRRGMAAAFAACAIAACSDNHGSSKMVTAYAVTNLVIDKAGVDPHDGAPPPTTIDPNLVNPWGLALAAPAPAGQSAPMWIANNGTQTSSLYDGTGAAFAGLPWITLPAGANGDEDPTGMVFNGTASFALGGAGAALFIFAGEGGAISGWSPNLADPTHAAVMYSDAGGAVYKGLALAANGGANFLYATDFHNAKVDVFDSSFAKVSGGAAFPFTDPALPAGYAPFGIQALQVGGQTLLYVSYAQQQGPANHDEVDGAGLGLVDVFMPDGSFVKTLVATGGALNAPWGMALAPADFGPLSGALLVGNFGNGWINAYDPSSGMLVAAVLDINGAPIAIPGLWGIAFGNDSASQPHNTLFFAAGTNDEADGTYGRIDLNTATVPASGTSPYGMN